MSKRIVAQVARVIVLIGNLALGGCTSDLTGTASHDFSLTDQFVPIFLDQSPRPADREISDPQAP